MSGYDGNGPTVIIDGEALSRLLTLAANLNASGVPVYKISLDRRREGVAFKINEAMWTSAYPTATPQA